MGLVFLELGLPAASLTAARAGDRLRLDDREAGTSQPRAAAYRGGQEDQRCDHDQPRPHDAAAGRQLWRMLIDGIAWTGSLAGDGADHIVRSEPPQSASHTRHLETSHADPSAETIGAFAADPLVFVWALPAMALAQSR